MSVHAPATVRYLNGTAAVFASVEEAVAQAAHDRSYPGHVDPAFVLEGDHGESHAAWGLGPPPPGVAVALSQNDVAALSCDCMVCEYMREMPKLAQGQDRADAYFKLLAKHLAGVTGLDAELRGLPPIKGASVPGGGFVVTSTAVALVAATAKTVLGLATGANNPVDIVEFAGSGDATSGNLLLELVFGTNASNAPGTNSTSFTPLQIRGPTQTLNATAGITWTAEPTVLTVVKRWRFAFPGGPFVLQSPLGRELNSIVTASTSGKFVGIRATASVAVTNSDWTAEVEE